MGSKTCEMMKAGTKGDGVGGWGLRGKWEGFDHSPPTSGPTCMKRPEIYTGLVKSESKHVRRLDKGTVSFGKSRRGKEGPGAAM